MSFLSFRYVLFFLVIYLINWIYVGGNCRDIKQKSYKKYSTLLLVESYAFIIISDWKTAICLFLQTIIVYFVSKGMNKYRNNRRLFITIFTCGIVFSIGQLITYKYCDFFRIKYRGNLQDLHMKLRLFGAIGNFFFHIFSSWIFNRFVQKKILCF